MIEETTPKLTKGKSTKLIIALMAGYSMVYMDKNMVATAIIPIAEQLNFSPSQTGMIMSMFFLGYSVMQIPSGWLADKVGAKKVLMISLGMIALFSFMFGSVSSLMLFFAIRLFAGIGHGGYPASVSKSIAENFVPEQRTMVQSLILSTSGIGGILAFTLGANLVTQNWRFAYLVLGSLFLVALVLVALFVPETKPASKVELAAKPKASFKEMITNKDMIILFVIMLFLNMAYYGNMSWLPSYLTSTYHLSIQSASYILAANSIAQVFGTIATGYLLSTVFKDRERWFVVGTAVSIAAMVIAFISTDILWLSSVLVVFIGMLSISVFTAVFAWPHKLFGENNIGLAIGMIGTGGTLGGFLSPMILGKLIEVADGSYSYAFTFIASSVLITGLLIFLVKKEKPVKK